jgi:hypothetical protein
MHQYIQTFLSENMIILLYNRYDELKLLIIPAFYQPSTKQLIIASHTQQLGWCKLSDIWINREYEKIKSRSWLFTNHVVCLHLLECQRGIPRLFIACWLVNFCKAIEAPSKLPKSIRRGKFEGWPISKQ